MITQYAIRRGAARKVLLLTLLVFSCMTLQAQSSPQAKARVAEIRKMYAAAKEMIAGCMNRGKRGWVQGGYKAPRQAEEEHNLNE